jgi:hypothetical protein
LKLGPLRAFRCPPACRRVRRRSTPSGFRTPSTVSPGLAPCEAGCHPRLGPARGFSQPLSGFLATPSSAALFRAATVPGILPSERSPRRDRLPLSGQLGFPAVIHRRAETRASPPYRPWFHRRPRPARPPGSPNDYELPFHEPKPASWSPWVSSPRNRFVPPASPTSKRHSLFESVRRQGGSPHQDGPLLSWVFAPLESSPSKPRSLSPQEPEGSSTPVRREAPGRCRQGRNPLDQERPRQLPRKSGSTCSTDSSPLRDWPTPPLGGAPPLMTSTVTTAAVSPGLQSLLVTCSAAFPPRRRLLFWGFLPLRQPRDCGSSPVLAYRFTGRSSSRLRSLS